MYGLSVTTPVNYTIDPAQLQAEIDSLRIAWGDSVVTEGTTSASVPQKRVSDNFSRSIADNRVGNNSDVILKRWNILYWNLWPEYDNRNAHLFPELLQLCEKRFGIKCTIKTEATPEVIQSFGNYDLVIIRTHGTYGSPYVKNGGFTIPLSGAFQDYLSKREASLGVIQYIKKAEAAFSLEKVHAISLGGKVFDNLLPNLSNTIIWTCICYATNTGFYTAAEKKNVLAFFGTDNTCDITGSYECLKEFLPKFYLGATARDAFNREADYKESIYKSYKYTFTKHYFGTTYHDYYFSGHGLRSSNRIYYLGVRPESWSDQLNTITDYIKASFRAPIEYLAYKDKKVGIYLMNAETNEAEYIPFTKNNTTISGYKEYEEMAASGTLNIAVPPLKPKTHYKYWTYLQDDDGVTLSDNYCSFTTPSNNFIQMQYQATAGETTNICTSADAFLGDSDFKIIGVDYGEGTGLEKFNTSHRFKTSGLHTVRIYYDGQMTGFRDFGSDDYPLSPFYECSALASITIPKGVTTIGEGAFYYCHNLNSITIPNSVTRIGKRAFQKCQILYL